MLYPQNGCLEWVSVVDFKTLETFVWIARLGSFRAAAERLYATQPAVSSRIANLERRLGVELFNRTGRRVTLTAKGRDLLDYAERLLALRSDMISAVANPESIQGTIRLGSAETIVHTWLPRLIEQLNQQYPGVTLEMDVDTTISLADKLIAREVDIAFLMGPVNHPDIANHPLSSYRLEWVASPRIQLPEEPVPVADLAQWPILTYPRLTKPHVAIQQMVASSKARVRIHSSSSLATIIRMATDGVGISALPLEIIRKELENGDLRIFSAENVLPDLDFTVSYAPRPESSVIRAVCNLALETAKTDK